MRHNRDPAQQKEEEEEMFTILSNLERGKKKSERKRNIYHLRNERINVGMYE